MDLDLLPALVAMADTGSLTQAGRRLGLSQPAVHQQLARLAEQVGHPLYRREGRRLVLTEAGARLAALGRRVLRERDAVLDDLHGAGAAPPVVCAGRGVWLYLVRELPPVTPMVSDGPGTVAAVQDGRAVLGIAAVAVPDGLRSRPVRTVGMVAVLPEDHALARRAEVSWSDLRGERWVLPPRGRPLRELVEGAAGPCEVAVEAEGWDLMLRFAVLGCGITLVNEGVAAGVPIADAPPVVYRALWHPSAEGVDALVDALFG